MADARLPEDEWCPHCDLWYPGGVPCPGCNREYDDWGPDDVVTLGPAEPPEDWFVADWEARQEEREREERAWAEHDGRVPLAWLTHPTVGRN